MRRVMITLLLCLLPALAQAQGGWRASVGSSDIYVNTTARPQTTEKSSLGDSTHEWLNIYVKNINFGSLGILKAADGTSGAPSIAFASTPTRGWFNDTANSCMAFTSGGESMCLGAGGSLALVSTSAMLKMGSISDWILAYDAANTASVRNGTNAQRFNIANTFTSAINREDFSVDWQSVANTVFVGSRTAATGTSRRSVFLSAESSATDNASVVELFKGAAPYSHHGVAAITNPTNFAIGVSGTGMLSQWADYQSTATSGSVQAFAITPTYNQPSGNAANTDLLINRTETMLGSGAQNLIDAQIAGTSKFTVDHTGFVSKLNGLATDGVGAVAVRKVGRAAGQVAANASVVSLSTPGSDASYEVSANVNLTAATTNTFTVTVTYTDETNTSRTLTLGFTQLSGATFLTAITNVTGVGPYESPVYHIRCKASTTITVATTGTFTSVTYNIEAVIKQTA